MLFETTVLDIEARRRREAVDREVSSLEEKALKLDLKSVWST